MARHSRFERQVGCANGQNVFDVLVVVVEGKHHFRTNSLLQADMIVARVRHLEIRINRDWNLTGGAQDAADRREMAERIPGPIVRREHQARIGTGCIRDGGISSLQELIGREASQLLYIIDVYNGIGRNRSMTRSDNTVQVVDAVYGGPKHGVVCGIDTLRPLSCNLRVGEGICETYRWTAAAFKVSPDIGRVAVEQTRE